MRYAKLFDLKFRKGFSTHELLRRYPHDTQRIGEIALLDVDEKTLRRIISEREMLNHLISLKKYFLPGYPLRRSPRN